MGQWKDVSRLLSLFLVACPLFTAQTPQPGSDTRYVGSLACRTCHTQIYNRWKTTRMANVVRDPKVHPDAILPDLSKPDPLVTFTKDDIAFVYGSKWKQRYFTENWRRLFPAAGPMGRHAPGLARLLGQRRDGLVGAAFTRRTT